MQPIREDLETKWKKIECDEHGIFDEKCILATAEFAWMYVPRLITMLETLKECLSELHLEDGCLRCFSNQAIKSELQAVVDDLEW